METKYNLNNTFTSSDFNELALRVLMYLKDEKKLVAQKFNQGENIWIIQAKTQEEWKKYVALDKATNIKLEYNDNTLSVEIGSGKWLTKSAGAAIGWFVLWPAFFVAAAGSYQQMHLHNEVNEFIANCINEINMAVNIICPSCGNQISSAATFCEKCGQKL